MTNKIFAVMIGLLLLCTLPIALADDINVDSNITPADEREARSILSPYGAEVRLLQLEKSVTRNILIGDIIINVLDGNEGDKNLTEAENTLNSLEMLLEEIKSTPRDGDKNELVTTYVELKKEARTLIADFKSQTNDLLTQEDRNEIMLQVRELDRNSFLEINQEIKDNARNFNAEKIKEQVRAMGLDANEPILERIRNGDANIMEAKEYMMQEFADMNLTEKKQVAANIKNAAIKMNIEERQIMDKLKPTLEQKLMNNIQNRIQDLNAWIERKGLDSNTAGKIQREDRIMDQISRIKDMIQTKDLNQIRDRNRMFNPDMNRMVNSDMNRPANPNMDEPMNGGGKP